MRVLIIDDDALVLRAFARMLRPHAVTAVKDARAALDMVRAGNPFDAILCDLKMPHMSGRAFFAELEALEPELADRVIFTSAGGSTRDEDVFLDGHPWLLKPFDARQLHRALTPFVPPSA